MIFLDRLCLIASLSWRANGKRRTLKYITFISIAQWKFNCKKAFNIVLIELNMWNRNIWGSRQCTDVFEFDLVIVDRKLNYLQNSTQTGTFSFASVIRSIRGWIFSDLSVNGFSSLYFGRSWLTSNEFTTSFPGK